MHLRLPDSCTLLANHRRCAVADGATTVGRFSTRCRVPVEQSSERNIVQRAERHEANAGEVGSTGAMIAYGAFQSAGLKTSTGAVSFALSISISAIIRPAPVGGAWNALADSAVRLRLSDVGWQNETQPESLNGRQGALVCIKLLENIIQMKPDSRVRNANNFSYDRIAFPFSNP
jgi:hypothetical protein